MILRDDILVAKNNDFLSLEIEDDSKIVIEYFNKIIGIPCSIKILMEDIWKLFEDLNIYNCHHIFR